MYNWQPKAPPTKARSEENQKVRRDRNKTKTKPKPKRKRISPSESTGDISEADNKRNKRLSDMNSEELREAYKPATHLSG